MMTNELENYPYPPDEGQTHFEGCWKTRGHHNCAVAEVYSLTAERNEYKRQADGYYNEAADALAEKVRLLVGAAPQQPERED